MVVQDFGESRNSLAQLKGNLAYTLENLSSSLGAISFLLQVLQSHCIISGIFYGTLVEHSFVFWYSVNK